MTDVVSGIVINKQPAYPLVRKQEPLRQPSVSVSGPESAIAKSRYKTVPCWLAPSARPLSPISLGPVLSHAVENSLTGN